MNAKARGFLPIIVSIAIIVIILKIVISQVIQFTTKQNEARAQEALRLLSVAFENYARDHMGSYAENITQLERSEPAYLGENILARTQLDGYVFSCERMESLGYRCSAAPAACGVSGRYVYSVSTGGAFQTEK